MFFLHFWCLGIALDSATECNIQILKCKNVPYLPGDCFKILSRSPVAFRLPPLPPPPPPQPRAQDLSGHMPDVNRERQIAVSMSARSKWALLHSLNRATDFSGRWRYRVSTASTMQIAVGIAGPQVRAFAVEARQYQCQREWQNRCQIECQHRMSE